MSQNVSNDTESSSTPQGRKIPVKLIVLLILLTLGGVAALLAPKVYRKYRTAQAEAIVAKAEELMEQDNHAEAFRLLTKNYSERPHEPVYLRAIAKFLKRAGAEPERSLHFWKQLTNAGASTHEDLVDYGINLCQSNNAGEALRIYESFSEEDKQKVKSIELLAFILQAEGNTAEAESLLRKALTMDKNNSESRFKLARIDLRNPFTEIQHKAYEDMWQIARESNKESILAIEALATDSKLTPAQSQELLRLVESNARATERVRYQVLQAYVNLNPDMQKTVVDLEIKRNTNRPIDSLFDYYRWLYLIKEYDHLIKIMPPDRAMKVREMFPIYIEVLAAKNQWKTIQDLLRNNPTIPTTPTDLALLRARCAQALGEPAENVRGHLTDACRAALATRDMNNFNRTTLLTQRLGYPDIAIDAFKKASELPQYKLMMLERVYKIHLENQDTVSAYQTVKEMLAAKPDSLEFREQFIYLSLLTGFEMELSALENQTDSNSKAKPLMEALFAYRNANADQLKSLLPNIRSEDLTSGQKAVYAGLLAITGHIAEGFSLAEKLTNLSLLKEEESFLKIAL